MIKTIKIKYFQSLGDIVLELHSGLNVLAGATKQGKSAIVRSAEWALRNSLRGLGFRPQVKKDTVSLCEITFDNDEFVRRERNEKSGDKGVNQFISSNNPPLSALRTEVPEEISRITMMDDLNIQGQEDERFLIGKGTSAGEVSKRLNEIVGLTIIDDIQDRAKEKLKGEKDKLETVERDIEKKSSELEGLAYLSKLEPLLRNIEEMTKYRQKVHESLMSADPVKDRILDIQDKVKVNKEWLEVEQLFQSVEKRQSTCLILSTKIDTSQSLLLHITSANDSFRDNKEWLQVESVFAAISMEQERLVDLSLSINKAVGLTRQIEQVEGQKKDSEKWLEVEKIYTQIEQSEKKLSEKRFLISKAEDILKSIREKGNRLQTQGNALRDYSAKLEELLSSVEICPIFEIECTRGK